jgi:hypothetical protein
MPKKDVAGFSQSQAAPLSTKKRYAEPLFHLLHARCHIGRDAMKASGSLRDTPLTHDAAKDVEIFEGDISHKEKL